jgi:hypothetical protein
MGFKSRGCNEEEELLVERGDTVASVAVFLTKKA